MVTFKLPQNTHNPAKIFAKKISIPLGEMLACTTDEGIVLLEFFEKKKLQKELDEISKYFNSSIVEADHKHFEALEHELEDYFNGSLTEFKVPLSPVGTEFQKKVWDVLREIPYGETRSYAAQAAALGNPKSVRAVANANGQNKISIIIPCHRVIGSNGTLTGYSGGIERKMKLLELEKAVLF